MNKNRNMKRNGSSLVECLVALLTMAISMLGMIKFRYYCVNRAENAKNLSMAVHSGQVIAETWKSQLGNANFDLASFTFNGGFRVAPSSDLLFTVPSEYIHTGQYDIQSEDRDFIATLAYQDSEDISNMRHLYVSVTWTDGQGQQRDYTLSTMMHAKPEDTEAGG